jgi:FkbM family methyltransferase
MSTNETNRPGFIRRMVVNPILQSARRLGVYVTRDPEWLAYEHHLRRMLSTLRINCVLDVGSYRGDFARMLRRLGYLGLIISFEPVSSNFEFLEIAREGDPDWKIHRMALGSAKGSAPIQVFTGTTFHSFLPPSEYGLAKFRDKMQVERTENVPLERLDGLLDEIVKEIDDPHIFLKVDTQGYDLEVMRGLGSRSAEISALQIEMAVNPIYREATNSLADALTYLEARGFQVSGLFPVTYESPGAVRVVEFDCLMCRSDGDETSSSESDS